MTEKDEGKRVLLLPDDQLHTRVGRVEDRLDSIGQSIELLLNKFESSPSQEGSLRKQQAEANEIFSDSSEESEVGPKARKRSSIEESELPNLESTRSDQFPDHLEDLFAECRKAISRNRWPASPAFENSPVLCRSIRRTTVFRALRATEIETS